MIPLGILASAGQSAADYELIETFVAGSNVSSITFSNLAAFASTYRHLQVRYVARSTVPETGIFARFNGDASSSYRTHYLLGNGSSVSSGSFGLDPRGQVGLLAGSGAAANDFRPGVIDLLDAYSTTKNKTVRGLSASQSAVILMSVLWVNTSSLTSWQITPDSGNFVAGSRFSLYGIKG